MVLFPPNIYKKKENENTAIFTQGLQKLREGEIHFLTHYGHEYIAMNAKSEGHVSNPR